MHLKQFSYYEQFGHKGVYKFPTGFTKYGYKPGDQVHLRVSQVYDPTKFWIVSKYQELEVHQNSLFTMYDSKRDEYRIPARILRIGMYCVVFIDGGFYRGVILSSPRYHHLRGAHIYLMDCGTVKLVPKNCLFYMSEEYFQVPQFVIRASLAGTCPKGLQWTREDVVEFKHRVANKILIGVVVNIDTQREVIEFNLCEELNGQMHSINEALIQEKHARYFDKKPQFAEEKEAPQPDLKYPYLFPSHELIESGKVCTLVSTSLEN